MLMPIALPLALRRPGAWLLYLQLRMSLPRARYHILAPADGAVLDDEVLEFVVLSPHGVFVIHAIERAGRFGGSRHDRMWTQKLPGGSSTFPNPLRLLRRRAAALAQAGGIDPAIVFPAAVLTGRCSLAPGMPVNVHGRSDCLPWLRAHDAVLLGEAGVERIRERLAHAASASGRGTRQAGGARCPACGAALGAYTYKTGQRAGQAFSGCTRFPVCTYRAPHKDDMRSRPSLSGRASCST